MESIQLALVFRVVGFDLVAQATFQQDFTNFVAYATFAKMTKRINNTLAIIAKTCYPMYEPVEI